MDLPEHIPTSKAPRKLFSLRQIQSAVSDQLKKQVGDIDLTSPAMPTLKLWSKQGIFSECTSLSQAVELVLVKVHSRPGRYQVATNPSNLSQVLRIDSRSHGRPAGSTGPNTQDDLLKTILEMLARLMEQVSAITHIVNSNETKGSVRITALEAMASKAMAAPVSPELTRAVNQLDGVRRHLLVSHDRETHLIRQQNTSVSRQFEYASALDIQRVLAKMSNVEDLLKQIVQKSD